MTLVEWDRATTAEREAYARSIGHGFDFRGIETHACGAIRREVATLTRDGSEFVLVPGGNLTLGFDATGWTPTESELADWNGFAEEFGLEEDISAHVAQSTVGPRRVRLPTLLVERTSSEVGWEPIAPGTPGVPEVDPGAGTVLMYRDGVEFRARAGRLERAVEMRHADVVRMFRSAGYRLPSSDEWEHLCGGGARTLYRWGDHAPGNQYPVDSGAFRDHLAPNAFGLSVASNPYHYEVVAEEDRLRGGDGGCAVCGGQGAFLAWLPLATSYFDPELSAGNPSGLLDPGYTFVRRVFEVG